MPQRIQRVPPGYLSFLGLRGTGNNPSEVSDFVQPVLDLEYLYVAQDLAVEVATTAGVNAPGGAATLEVPAGEAWRIVAISAQLATVLVGDVFNVSIGFALSSAGLIVQCANPPRIVATAAAQTMTGGLFIPQRFMLPAGHTIIARLEEAVGNASSLSVVALFQRERQ